MKRLRPYLLLALKTSVTPRAGPGVHWSREVLAHHEEGGADRQVSRAARLIPDPAEYEAAQKLRQQLLDRIRGRCEPTDWGLMVRAERWPALRLLIDGTQEEIAAFNQAAASWQIWLAAVPGVVDPAELEWALGGPLRVTRRERFYEKKEG